MQKNKVRKGNDSEELHMYRNTTECVTMVRFSVPSPGQKGVCCVVMMAVED